MHRHHHPRNTNITSRRSDSPQVAVSQLVRDRLSSSAAAIQPVSRCAARFADEHSNSSTSCHLLLLVIFCSEITECSERFCALQMLFDIMATKMQNLQMYQ